MSPDLSTTNVFLGIIAAVSALQLLAVIAACVAAFAMYRYVLKVAGTVEERHVAPAVARVNTILDDVKGVTSTVKNEARHIERLVEWIVEGVSRRRRPTSEEPPSRVM
jgi:hypothetical protein